MKSSKSLKIAAIALSVALFSAQGASAAVSLTGAGSTFAAPLIESCKAGYNAATGNTFTYTGGGSGAGRTASDKKTSLVNFSDTPHGAARAGVIHIPVIAGPIAVMYKLSASKPLYLSPETVAGIFSGQITMWNDPKIAADNNRKVTEVIYKTNADGTDAKDKSGKPIVLRTQTKSIIYTLPNQKIKVIYRSDSSGTSGAFTAALHGAAPDVWTKAGNNSFTTSFPGNINDTANLGRVVGASGSAAVTALAAKTMYSITYAESSYAKANGLGKAFIKNEAGNFQAPDSSGVATLLGSATVADNGILTYNYTNKQPGSYLFGTATYALVDTKQENATDAAAVKSLLSYLVSAKCVNTKPELEYTQITGPLADIDTKLIAKIN